MAALEAARVEEGKVFEGPHPIHLIHDLIAPQTGGLVEVGAIHFGFLSGSLPSKPVIVASTHSLIIHLT